MRGDAYNRVEQWLHWIALEPKAVRELSFELERSASLAKDRPSEGSVYVCGLARSGTTVLLRALARLDAFRSLTYRDMPFVLAPNLWRRVAHRANRASAPGERAHGDGIMVDFDSPEAFEEVFWRTFADEPHASTTFGRSAPSAEVLEAFAEYRAVIANPRGSDRRRRYLSKNNNNVVRLRELVSDPTAAVLMPYREPVACARSLHRQHLRFSRAQAENAFTRRYMRWLGHHEFGLDHRPFDFAAQRMDKGLDPAQPDYWLDYWNAVHEELPARLDSRVHLVEHDRFCAQPVPAMERIVRILGLEADAASMCAEIRPAAREAAPHEFSPARVDRATRTFEMLNGLPNNIR